MSASTVYPPHIAVYLYCAFYRIYILLSTLYRNCSACAFYVFERCLLCSPNLHLIKNTLKTVSWKWLPFKITHPLLYYNSNVIYSFDGKAELSSLLQSSVSHDPSEIILTCWVGAQETLLININVKTDGMINIFVWKLWYIFYRINSKNVKLHFF